MKIHEYQAKALLREFGVAVPKGDVADTPAQAREIAQRLGGKVVVKAQIGLGDFQARRLAFGLGVGGDLLKQAVPLIRNLFALYLAKDCSLVEINPLVVTKDGRVFALDAKLNFDDNALYRHRDVVELRDIHEEDPLDVEASKYSLNYIKLDGNVGCMVNGAGLAMATMDIVKLAGGEPANFLDVGGGASPEQIENAFRILSSDPSVKAVFINVFGGILRVDRLAEGIIGAVRKLGLELPVVLRAEGTNVEQGKKMLADSGLALTMASDMADGAAKAVAFARGGDRK
jgi:succinyl-CoA synthetase beta subunit